MKTVISILAGILIFCLVFFVVDPAIVNWVMNVIPETEWKGLIKVIVWLVTLLFTMGLGLWLSVAVGILVAGIIKQFS